MARLERDLEDVIQRIRSLESLQTPGQAQAVSDLRNLQKRVDIIDREGSALVKERFIRIDERIEDIREDVRDIKDDQKASRRMMQSALVTASLAIGVNIVVGIILFVVLR